MVRTCDFDITVLSWWGQKKGIELGAVSLWTQPPLPPPPSPPDLTTCRHHKLTSIVKR